MLGESVPPFSASSLQVLQFVRFVPVKGLTLTLSEVVTWRDGDYC